MTLASNWSDTTHCEISFIGTPPGHWHHNRCNPTNETVNTAATACSLCLQSVYLLVTTGRCWLLGYRWTYLGLESQVAETEADVGEFHLSAQHHVIKERTNRSSGSSPVWTSCVGLEILKLLLAKIPERSRRRRKESPGGARILKNRPDQRHPAQNPCHCALSRNLNTVELVRN